MTEDLVYRLRKRAEIRRQISTRKSVQEGKPDRMADLLDEAARRIEELVGRLEQLADSSMILDDENEELKERIRKLTKPKTPHSCDIPGCVTCGNPSDDEAW